MRSKRWTCGLVMSALACAAGVGGVASAGAAGRGRSAATHPPRSPLRAAAARASAGDASNVMPFPGTPDASPRTEIILATASPHDLSKVTVTGSRSGAVAGLPVSLPSGGTAIFFGKPFAAGERVSVNVKETSGATLAWSFQIAKPPPPPLKPRKHTVRLARAPRARAAAAPPPAQSFHSRPDLRPPVVTVSGGRRDEASGDIFLDVQHSRQVGPLVLAPSGQVVYFAPQHAPNEAFDVREQTFAGQPALTYWVGQQFAGHGAGHDVILNDHYQPVATVQAAEGYRADLHEFQITPADTAYITVYSAVGADLRSVGGARDGAIYDGLVEEIDIRTGQLLWEWHALGHIPLRDSYAARPSGHVPWDFFHINSIQPLANGDVLISARNTSAVYLISHTTGKIIWELGGRTSTFKVPRGARFSWQHDARLLPDGTVTLFNDASNVGAAVKPGTQSTGLRLRLERGGRARALQTFRHAPPVLATTQGNVQTLPNHDVFIGWGSQPYFSEYTPAGRQILTGSFHAPTISYRAFRFPWQGLPVTTPAIAVTFKGGHVDVYASWNGATDVSRWEVLGGADPNQLSSLFSVPDTGFETTIPVSSSDSYLAVRALSSTGATLGTSIAVAK